MDSFDFVHCEKLHMLLEQLKWYFLQKDRMPCHRKTDRSSTVGAPNRKSEKQFVHSFVAATFGIKLSPPEA